MPLMLLMCLMLACMPVRWPSFPFGGASRDALLATLAAVVGLITTAAILAGRTRQRMVARPGDRERLLHGYRRGRFWHLMATLLIFALTLYGLGWGAAVQEWARMDGEPLSPTAIPLTYPGSELLILLPLMLMMIGSWCCFYDIERELHHWLGAQEGPFMSRATYLGLHIRQNLALVAAPLLLFVLSQGIGRMFPSWARSPWYQPLMLLPLAAVLILMPWILRLVFGLRRLADGPLRDRLQAAGQRLGVHFSEMLLWDTRRSVANAMVVGVIPQLRYVLLTDRLLDHFTPEEVEAVFGHEAGHVRHRHVVTYLMFLILSVATLYGVFSALEVIWFTDERSRDWWAQKQEAWASWLILPPLAVLGIYVFVVFGFLSRWCERQADVFGCRAVSCDCGPSCTGHDEQTPLSPGGRGLCPTGIRIFSSALNKVADLNGLSRSKPGWIHSWQHSTIAKRVAFLESLIDDPKREPHFQKCVGWLKWGLVGFLALSLLGLGQFVGWEKIMAAL